MANQYGTDWIHFIEIKFSSIQEDSDSATALVKHSWDMSELKKIQGKEYERIRKKEQKKIEFGKTVN